MTKKLPRSQHLYRMGLLETFCFIAAEEYNVLTYLTDDSLIFDEMSYLFKLKRY